MHISDIIQLFVLKILSFIFLGYLIAYLKFLTLETFRKILNYGVVYFLLPILILEKVCLYIKKEDLWTSMGMSLSAFVMIFSNWGWISFWTKRKIKDKSLHNTIILGNTFHNYGFLVFPFTLQLMGDRGLALLFPFVLTCDALIWSFGVLILKEKKSDRNFLKILPPPAIIFLLSSILVYLNLTPLIPGEILKTAGLLGKATIPTALVCIGGIVYFSMKDINFRKIPLGPLLFSLTNRTFFLPLFWLSLFFWLLPNIMTRNILAIEAIMPVSVTTIALVGLYGGNREFISALSLLSNIMGIVTVPLYWGLLNYFLEN